MTDDQYQNEIIEHIRKDPEIALSYVDTAIDALGDGNVERMIFILRAVTEAKGGSHELAKRINVKATSIDEALAPGSDPSMDTVISILDGLGWWNRPPTELLE